VIADSATARKLTHEHRAQQLLLRAATARQIARLWPLLDGHRLDATYPRFAAQVSVTVRANRATSAGLAARYLRAHRVANGVRGAFTAVDAGPLAAQQFATALRVTTVVSVKSAAARGVLLDQSMADALVRASGSMSRLVLDGGRDTITRTVAADPRASGWQRVVGGPSCDFCWMLADRGAVYSEATADFAAHDHCGCSVAPVYGDKGRSVRDYVPTSRSISEADRARVRDWMDVHPRST
jgi:hypothetical protein